MDRRFLLRVSVKSALLAGAAAFAGVFFSGLLGRGDASGDGVDVDGIRPGDARLVSWHGKPVWIVHRSRRQLAAMEEISRYVTEAAPQATVLDPLRRSLKPDYGLYLAETARTGILVQYRRERPDGLIPGVPWHGGFVDPGSEAFFDPAGRRYCNTKGEPLGVPPYRFDGDGTTVRLGAW